MQGYGITGDSKEGGTLLEINVTLIETQDCIELLDVYLNNNTVIILKYCTLYICTVKL